MVFYLTSVVMHKDNPIFNSVLIAYKAGMIISGNVAYAFDLQCNSGVPNCVHAQVIVYHHTVVIAFLAFLSATGRIPVDQFRTM